MNTFDFSRVVCINLDRRPDRWKTFCDGLPDDWPFSRPERIAAVDGQQTKPPPWWTAGRGAWGCYLSHLGVIEDCLRTGTESVLLLEDDAVFCQGFSRLAADWIASLPTDWQCVYLGGQHLHHVRPPRQIAPGVYVPHNVNRTHAWGLRGDGLRIVRDWLTATDWQKGHHLDHRLGQLHQSGRLRVFCPGKWLVFQRAGQSNISGRAVPEKHWRGSADIAPRQLQRPLVAVVGPFRSGTSCVAGVLHRLGVSMGRRWPSIRGNPRGTYEAVVLSRICRQSYREPWMGRRPAADRATDRLRQWLARREPSPSGILGAKHPTLCLLLPELLAAWPDVRVLAVDRPAEEAAASGRDRNWPGWHQTDRIVSMLRDMARSRDAAIANAVASCLRMAYYDVLADPAEAVQRIVDWASLAPAPEQIDAAVAFVEPSLRTQVI